MTNNPYASYALKEMQLRAARSKKIAVLPIQTAAKIYQLNSETESPAKLVLYA